MCFQGAFLNQLTLRNIYCKIDDGIFTEFANKWDVTRDIIKSMDALITNNYYHWMCQWKIDDWSVSAINEVFYIDLPQGCVKIKQTILKAENMLLIIAINDTQ